MDNSKKKMCIFIEVFEEWACRGMLTISRTTKNTTQEVLRRVQLKKACLLADVTKKKMGYFGHIIRHSTIQHALLEGKIEGWCSRGRTRTHCIRPAKDGT